jgi:glutamine cyclotransferase
MLAGPPSSRSFTSLSHSSTSSNNTDESTISICQRPAFNTTVISDIPLDSAAYNQGNLNPEGNIIVDKGIKMNITGTSNVQIYMLHSIQIVLCLIIIILQLNPWTLHLQS